MRKVFFSLFIVVGFLIHAQDDAYSLFIKHTSVAIHKAHKEMLAHKQVDAGGLLAKAVILQNNAVILYKTNPQQAVCASAAARKCAAQVIKTFTQEGNTEFYSINSEEKNMLTNCASEVDLYKESKKKAIKASEDDKDYISQFNGLTIDLNK